MHEKCLMGFLIMVRISSAPFHFVYACVWGDIHINLIFGKMRSPFLETNKSNVTLLGWFGNQDNQHAGK